jgi:FkbM family methyltransferase
VSKNTEKRFIGQIKVASTRKRKAIGYGYVQNATIYSINKMKEGSRTNSTKLGAIFYPTFANGKDIPFESLYLPWIWKEIYFDGIYVDIFNQKKDMVVIDVGCNVGLVTKYMREFAKKVYAIEPSPEHFEALKKNKEFNKWDNVDVFNAAMADRDGKMKMYSLDSNRTCNSLINNYGQDSFEVETFRFDTFLNNNNIEKVDFVKLDVEGAERIILPSDGFANVHNKIQAIEIEFHYPDWKDLVRLMVEKYGYSARQYECSAIVVLFTK